MGIYTEYRYARQDPNSAQATPWKAHEGRVGSGRCNPRGRRCRGGAPRGRASVTGAWGTLAGCSGAPRFLLVVSDEVGPGGSGGAPGYGVPHQRPRGAPLPHGGQRNCSPGAIRAGLAHSKAAPDFIRATRTQRQDRALDKRLPIGRWPSPESRDRAARGIISACQVFVTGGRHAMVPPLCGRSSLPKDRFPRRLEAEARVVHA